MKKLLLTTLLLTSMFVVSQNEYLNYQTKYKVDQILNDYSKFCRKDANYSNVKYGILKGERILLPMIFTKIGYGHRNGNIVLGFKNKSGIYSVLEERWIVPMKYSSIETLSNGLYKVTLNNKLGIIDITGEIIVPIEWTGISTVNSVNNYLILSKGPYGSKKVGLYNVATRSYTIPVEYSNITKLSDRNLFLINKNNEFNIFNLKNEPLFKTWYTSIHSVEQGGLYIVSKNGLYGVVDDNEKTIVPLDYLTWNTRAYQDGSYLAKNKDGMYGFIKATGEIVLDFNYESITSRYSSNNFLAKRSDKCGVVHISNGKPSELVTCEFDDLQISGKEFIYEKNGKFGLLNESGKNILDKEYQSIIKFKNSLYAVKSKNKFYLMDGSGNIISDGYLSFSQVTKNNSSYGSQVSELIRAETKNGYVLVDLFGKRMSEEIFEEIDEVNYGRLIVKKGGKYGIYSITSKKMLSEYIYDGIVFDEGTIYGFIDNMYYHLKYSNGAILKTKIKHVANTHEKNFDTDIKSPPPIQSGY